MPSKSAKGKQTEKKAREFLEDLGYECYSPPHTRYAKQRDVLSYGDIVYLKKSLTSNAYNKNPGERYFLQQFFGHFGFVQVKSRQNFSWERMVKLAKKFPLQVRIILMMWNKRRKRFRFFFYSGNARRFKEFEFDELAGRKDRSWRAT